jgi:hypothetical protein
LETAAGDVCRSPWRLAVGVVSGAMNGAVGDEVLVILLSYLMPVWAAILARALLNE